MNIETKFDIEQYVILKTDNDRLKRIITNITITKNGIGRYCLMCGDKESWHYEFEMDACDEKIKTKAGFMSSNGIEK